MKKVGKYITLTLLLLLGLCCVGILYLFFLPNSSLFNITYIGKSSEHISKQYSINSVNKINLNSRKYDVNILSTKETDIYVEVFSNPFGFVLTKNKDLEISSTLSNNILTFDIKEPHGAAIINDSYINLYIPTTKSIDLSLTNYKAKTTINSSDLVINHLSYSTHNGDLHFEKGEIAQAIDLNLGKSTFTISNAVKTHSNDLNLSLTTGKLNATNCEFGNVAILANARGVINLGNCESLTENIGAAGGRINANRLSHINVKTTDTIISVNEVTDGAIVELTKSGSISINTLSGVSAFTTSSGNINLGLTKSSLTATTDDGNINISKAMYKISAKTNYGNININFAEDAASYKDNNNARAITATLKKGKLTVNGVENINITVTDSASINVNMKNVFGENLIDGKNGNVKVVVNKDSQYVLKTLSSNGTVRVNLTQTTECFGYTTKEERLTNVNCSTSQNILNITTNYGNLLVLDTNFA